MIPIYRIRTVPTQYMLDNNMSKWSSGWRNGSLVRDEPNSGLFLYDNSMPLNFASLIIAFFATSALFHLWALVFGAFERTWFWLLATDATPRACHRRWAEVRCSTRPALCQATGRTPFTCTLVPLRRVLHLGQHHGKFVNATRTLHATPILTHATCVLCSGARHHAGHPRADSSCVFVHAHVVLPGLRLPRRVHPIAAQTHRASAQKAGSSSAPPHCAGTSRCPRRTPTRSTTSTRSVRCR